MENEHHSDLSRPGVRIEERERERTQYIKDKQRRINLDIYHLLASRQTVNIMHELSTKTISLLKAKIYCTS